MAEIDESTLSGGRGYAEVPLLNSDPFKWTDQKLDEQTEAWFANYGIQDTFTAWTQKGGEYSAAATRFFAAKDRKFN